MMHDANMIGEKHVLLIKHHWMQFALPLFLMALSWSLYITCEIVSLLLAQWNHITSVMVFYTGHALLLLFHHAAFYQIFSMSTSRILLTNRRLLDSEQRLWLADETTDVPLWKIRSLEVSQRGILQDFFNYGSIIINRGELPSLYLVPQPSAVHAHIVQKLQELQYAFRPAFSVGDNSVA